MKKTIIFLLLLFAYIVCINGQELAFSWKVLSYASAPIATPFIPANNVPTGVATYRDRVFITVPRLKAGVPSTLNYVRYDKLRSSLEPALISYPDFATNEVSISVANLISVWRPVVDVCKRLWVVDTGVNAGVIVHAATISIYNLKNDTLIRRYTIPATVVLPNTQAGLQNIAIDVNSYACDDAHAYISNAFAGGSAVVYSFRANGAWFFTNPNFALQPAARPINVNGVPINLNNNLISMAVGKKNIRTKERLVYFHAEASVNEFSVSNAILKNQGLSPNGYGAGQFQLVGSRGLMSQAADSVIDKFGIAFFGEIQDNQITCWDTGRPLNSNNVGIIDAGRAGLLFPSDLSIDREKNLWALANNFLVNGGVNGIPNVNIFNFYVYKYNIRAVTRNTVCEPTVFRGDYLGTFKRLETGDITDSYKREY